MENWKPTNEFIDNGSLYYGEPKYKIGNDKYYMYMCEGLRGRGKTTRWLSIISKRCIDENKKFVYLRRSDKEMELALQAGLFNGCKNIEEYKSFWEEYPKSETRNGMIYLINKNGEKTHIGYYFSLNNVKGISIEDADCLLFDEYVAQKRGQYKGGEHGLNEPTLFLRLLETLFRLRKFWVILLGNRDTPSNPYNECWKIPFNCPMLKDKSRGLWYEFDFSKIAVEHKANTPLGIISAGTSYANYSLGTKSLEEVDESLIAQKPAHAVQLYNVKMFGKLITIWKDGKNAVLYLTSECKFNSSCATICVTNTDMTINTDFIKYDGVFLDVMKAYYGGGRMRFNNQETASLFATMLSLS